MERFKKYMYQTNPRNDLKLRLLFGITGIVFIFLYFQIDIFSHGIILIEGIFILLFVIAHKFIIKRNFILVDDEGIKAEFAYLDLVKLRHLIPPYLRRLDKVYVKWEDIQSVSKEPLKITIVLNNDSQKEIYIGDLSYKDHQELREKLQEYIEAKGITTTI